MLSTNISHSFQFVINFKSKCSFFSTKSFCFFQSFCFKNNDRLLILAKLYTNPSDLPFFSHILFFYLKKDFIIINTDYLLFFNQFVTKVVIIFWYHLLHKSFRSLLDNFCTDSFDCLYFSHKFTWHEYAGMIPCIKFLFLENLVSLMLTVFFTKKLK